MFDPVFLAQTLVSGIGIGCVFGLIGIGYCVIYNASGIVNFAQGAFVMLGGMVTHVLLTRAGLPLFVSSLIATAIFRLVVAFILECQAVFRKFCCSVGLGVLGLR